MSGKSGLATALTAAALVVLMASNLLDLRNGASNMETALTNQSKLLGDSAKVESQLDALAKGVQRLAADGNTNAQAIIATLKANGVNIQTPAT
jgi:intracellular sulfur oxidation DsrE/DsrF family protein